METIGIRELRQHASRVIESAMKGIVYGVTNHGKETGVVIGMQSHLADHEQKRTGVTPDQIANSGIYGQPTPAGYHEALLEIVERGREESGRIGEQ